MSVLTSAWLATFLTLAIDACTLALHSPSALTQNCQFDGDQTACGACIRMNCDAQLGSCCGDPNCQTTLDALDQCAGDNDQTACSTLRQNASLGACVSASCKDFCLGQGKGSCGGDSTDCVCDAIAPSDASQCSEMSVGGGSCCADFGWPGPGLTCSCLAFRCKETGDGCSCGSGDDGPNLSCTGLHCCVSTSQCHCSNTVCEDFETAVPQCSADLVTCVSASRVSSCSESVH